MAAKHVLSPAEKYLVVNISTYFQKEKAEGASESKGTVRDRVKEATGFATSTISAIMKHWNEFKDPSFSKMGSSERGHPPRNEAENFPAFIRALVSDKNKECKPSTAQILCNEFQEQHSISISARAMRRLLRKLGMRYIRGKTRDILAESEGTVAFRATYLDKVQSNRNGANNPVLPEVFLDESYCNLHHVSSQSWVDTDKIQYQKSGRGNRFCIVAAGVVRRERYGLVGGFVDESLCMWQSQLKGTDSDYHGNFNNAICEDWFEKLCAQLSKAYGPCRIHLDGASYHKRITNSAPSAQSLKAHIQEWLRTRGVEFDNNLVKAQLLALMRENKPKPIYQANIIATAHGHYLLFTPPYHPELQPIELVWSQAKQKIALDPASSMKELGTKLMAAFVAISSKDWMNSYRHVQKYEHLYGVGAEDCLLADDDDEDDDTGDEEEIDTPETFTFSC